MQPNVKKGSLQNPQSLMTFPWEKQEKKEMPSKEVFDKLFPKTLNNE